MDTKIKPAFSYFGGKRNVADQVWSKFGKVSNYVEPFMGSLALLLANPSIPKIETVNDIDCLLCNFYRAVSEKPEEVAKFADYPVSEADLHARHRWLLDNVTLDFKTKMEQDPHFYDAKMAGYWVWGQCASVGNNWLSTKGLKALPLLSSAGGGIHGLTYDIQDQFNKLKARLRRVRVCCGDWKRIMSPAVLHQNVGLNKKDITAVFLDPPYPKKVRDKVYRNDQDVFLDVVDWAIKNGDNENLRIAVCGYDGDFGFPATWSKLHWKANGGFSSLAESDTRGKQNRLEETIWFSPNCL